MVLLIGELSGYGILRMSLRVRDHFRAHGRQRVALAATLRSGDDETTVTLDEGGRARIRDIGLGGACVELARVTAEGQPPQSPRPPAPAFLRAEAPIIIEVTSPTLWDPLVLRGRVAWLRGVRGAEPARFGVRFEHADQGGLFALFQLLGVHTFAR